jgi:prepilin-type N-terminal cleavage/methylation domain-containing protein
MSELRRRGLKPGEDGFTLVELLITIVILGIIAFGLTGTVIRYLQDTAESQGRFNETHDVQFAAAYWQNDVSSLGVRSPTYVDDGNDVHTYPLLQSVNIPAACPQAPGTFVGRLAWSQFNSLTSNATPDLITVTYVSSGSGSGPYTLTRTKCTGSTVDSTVRVARQLSSVPVMDCSGPAGTSCTGADTNVPTIIKLTLTARDPSKRDPSSYTATLTGERRQS